jgi:hypothetical protein
MTNLMRIYTHTYTYIYSNISLNTHTCSYVSSAQYVICSTIHPNIHMLIHAYTWYSQSDGHKLARKALSLLPDTYNAVREDPLAASGGFFLDRKVQILSSHEFYVVEFFNLHLKI